MPTQTEAQCQTEIRDAVAIFHEVMKCGNINTGTLQSQTISNFIARQNTFFADTPGDYTVQARAAIMQMRSALAGCVSPGTARAVLTPLLRNYAQNTSGFTTGQPVETDPVQILSRIYRDFISGAKTVQSRNLTFASPAAGSNVGNGVINRLTVDAYGQNIEACHIEAKRAECIAGAETGTPPGEENFLFRGAVRPLDHLQLTNVATNTGGSGGYFTIAAVSGRQSMLANPSFEQYSGSASSGGIVTFGASDSLTSWTPGAETITNYSLDETNTYRTFQGITTPRALRFNAAGSMTQTSDINNLQFDPNRPYYFQIAYNRSVGSATGTLTLTLGLSSVQVVLAAQSGWNILRLTLDRRCWPHNFAATTQSASTNTLMNVKIQWTSATGTLLVDDAILVPMTRFDGHWYTVVGGATLFVADNHDSFTWTDTFAGGTNPAWDTGIIQTWLWRTFGMYLPSTTGGATWTDPTV